MCVSLSGLVGSALGPRDLPGASRVDPGPSLQIILIMTVWASPGFRLTRPSFCKQVMFESWYLEPSAKFHITRSLVSLVYCRTYQLLGRIKSLTPLLYESHTFYQLCILVWIYTLCL